MSYAIGLKAIKSLCERQKTIDWYHAKLSSELFKPNEVPVFEWVDQYVRKHHALPQLETLHGKFSEVADAPVPEPSSYYIEDLERAYFHQQITRANIESSKILKDDPTAWEQATGILRTAITNISLQRYRQKIMDFGKEGPSMVLQAYHNLDALETVGGFGWPYMDAMGGAMPGDVISFVGRPQTGKSWLSLFTALHNWRGKKKNVLFVSMEMSHLPIAQRAATMIAGTNLTQLKHGWGHPQSYATPTYDKFTAAMVNVVEESDGAKFYVINGNLAADVEDIYLLANQLGCEIVIIDGAYLCRNKNTRLDRYTRAAENCEAMKRFSEDLQIPTFSSWQFNREASKKQKSKQGGVEGQAGLEDIGYSDVIGQISSVALGLFQEDNVETAIKKMIRVLKGRGGEVGQFEINWDFDAMDFSQIGTHTIATQPEDIEPEYAISEDYL